MSASVAGQTRERYGISAKAGGVNAVVGHVMVNREDQKPQLLTSKDNLTSGDKVTSGSLSNAEVLLNPGSYFRLAENSEFQFEDIALDNLRLRLVKGSAIIEATGVADMDLGIKIATPHGEFSIIRSGVYRIDVNATYAELAVRKGRASFGPNKTDIVKGGSVVTLSSGMASVAKLSKTKDGFDTWSKERAELLAKANARLTYRTLNGYLASNASWNSWVWGPRPFGLWTFSPRAGCYTFLPFYWGWSSPYGHSYGSYYWGGGGGCCNHRTPGGTIVSNNGGGSGGSIIAGGNPNPGGIGGTGGGTPTPVPGGAPMPQPGTIRDLDVSGKTVRKLDP